jgi:hypothetical protein
MIAESRQERDEMNASGLSLSGGYSAAGRKTGRL